MPVENLPGGRGLACWPNRARLRFGDGTVCRTRWTSIAVNTDLRECLRTVHTKIHPLYLPESSDRVELLREGRRKSSISAGRIVCEAGFVRSPATGRLTQMRGR